MNKSLLFLCVAPIGFGAASFGLSYYYSTGRPIIQAPEVVDLGVQELGRRVSSSFSIRNAGREKLTLHGFGSNCGCLAILAKGQGAVKESSSVHIDPGQHVEMTVNLSISRTSASSLREIVWFKTNDPARSEVRVEIVAQLQGSIVAVPSELNMGEIVVGKRVLKVVQLRDTGRKAPFRRASVKSSAPDFVRVVEVAHPKSSPKEDKDAPAGAGVLLCQLSVEVLAPARPGSFRAYLEVYEETGTDPVVKVPVYGSSVGRFRFAPSSVVLPRVSKAGPVYNARCVCLNSEKTPFELKATEGPPGFAVSVHKEEAGAGIMVTIECRAPGRVTPGQRIVRLTATHNGGSEIIELPVVFWRPRE